MPENTADTASIVVLGAGSYGSALASLLAGNDNNVCLWARSADDAAALNAARSNQKYLPGVTFPDNLVITSDLGDALRFASDILVAVPSHAFRDCLQAIKPSMTDRSRVIWASKGLDPESGELLGEVLIEELGSEIPHGILSGPTFAKEMALGLPTAITLAATDQTFAADMAAALHNERFRVYTSDDIVGVQIGGAVKNVIAIGAGMADGLGFGANARTALIARGLAEMTRLGVAVGGKLETFTGMAGMGDLVLTCTDDQSRNRRYGLALGKGESSEQAQHTIGQVVEGVRNAKEVVMLASRFDVEMPISEAIYQVIYEGLDPKMAAHLLLTRDLKSETEAH